jgi:hypothetical protein
MYPEHPRFCRFESDAERLLYDELKRQLPDTYTVLYSVPLQVRPDQRSELNVEIDFLVVDPERGLLVLEVKGGGIYRDGRSRQWYSVDSEQNRHPIDDPFAQARKNRFALETLLEHSPRSRRFHYRIRHAVIFPDIRVGKSFLGPDAPPEIILDGPALQNLGTAVQRALGPPTAESRVGSHALAAIVDILSPSVEISRPSLGWRIKQTERQIVELTEQQYRILQVLARQRRVKVCGCAGSGKTMLAIQKARQLAAQGLRVLLTCYNQSLASWMRSNFVPSSDYGWPGEETLYHLVVTHYHEFARQLCERAGVAFDPPLVEPAKSRFYDDEVPELLLQALNLVSTRFDAVIVDEGQDFREEWWLTLLEALADREQDFLYVFYDDNQLLYTDAVSIPIEGEPYLLSENIRNTRQIHRAFLPYYRGIELPACRGPDGAQVEQIAGAERMPVQALRGVLKRLICEERVSPDDIVVLSPVQRGSCLREGLRLDSWTLTRQRAQLLPGQIRVSTIHSFKGLESPVVILAELDKARPERAAQLAYIALSRARSHLIVFGDLPPPPAESPQSCGPGGPLAGASSDEEGDAGELGSEDRACGCGN